MRAIGSYTNGNYRTIIFDDGTKGRMTKANEFKPAFAENCDVCITKRCDGGCPWCYEGCDVSGKHANIMEQKWIDTLHPYTELAINGNDLTHPDLESFLKKMKEKKVIVNMTVNQKHFERREPYIRELVNAGLIYGLGISLNIPTDEFIKRVKKYPNAVIHTICGILSEEDIAAMANRGLKILILGYKDLCRGADWLSIDKENILRKQEWLKEHLWDYTDKFQVISFDNLAIKQLEVQSRMTSDEWDNFYMGDDGNFTFYIDAVSGTFSKNSMAPENERYSLLDSVDEMFNKIKC